MNEGTEGRVFLRRSTDGGKGPDCPGAVVDGIDLEDREFVFETVVAEMVAEGAFRLGVPRVDAADDTEIGFRGHRQAVWTAYQRHTTTAEQSGKGEFRHSFR